MRAFCGILEQAMAKKGGALDPNDVESAFESFLRSSPAMQQAYVSSFDKCTRTRRRLAVKNRRHDAFGRLLVEPFAHLLIDTGSERVVTQGRAVPRAVLPAFFRAMRIMLGEEILENRRAACHMALEKLQATHDDAFEWSHYHNDPSMRRLRLHSLADIAACFANFDRRMDWFVNLLANGAAEAAGHQGVDSTGLTFGREEFLVMMRALFAGLAEDHGGAALDSGETAAVDDFLANLERYGGRLA